MEFLCLCVLSAVVSDRALTCSPVYISIAGGHCTGQKAASFPRAHGQHTIGAQGLVEQTRTPVRLKGITF